jgi:hypothetical protein
MQSKPYKLIQWTIESLVKVKSKVISVYNRKFSSVYNRKFSQSKIESYLSVQSKVISVYNRKLFECTIESKVKKVADKNFFSFQLD